MRIEHDVSRQLINAANGVKVRLEVKMLFEQPAMDFMCAIERRFADIDEYLYSADGFIELESYAEAINFDNAVSEHPWLIGNRERGVLA